MQAWLNRKECTYSKSGKDRVLGPKSSQVITYYFLFKKKPKRDLLGLCTGQSYSNQR